MSLFGRLLKKARPGNIAGAAKKIAKAVKSRRTADTIKAAELKKTAVSSDPAESEETTDSEEDNAELSANEDDEQIVKEQSSASEDNEQIVKEQSSASEDDEQIVKDQSPASKDDEQVITEELSTREGDEQIVMSEKDLVKEIITENDKISEEAASESTFEIEEEPAGPAAVTLDMLEPADVFGYFRAISAIPHGSFHTKEISDYLESFAKDHGLSYVRDELGNLIISRPGSAGCEDAEPIALQGHIDMVCEKEASNPINMEKEAITLKTDGEWLWADRTTLGGDDGIAVAIMLALLADKTIKCPPLECVFTVDEEVGLLGAYSLDLSTLKSRRMINLDSEDEGVITASCAGGAEDICTLSGKRREKKGEVLEISVDGLRGGHSGERISHGRANAVLLLTRLLYRLESFGKYCLISFNGGTRDNAIPRDSKAEIIFTGDISRNEIKEAIAGFARDIAREYSVTDPDIHIHAKWPDKGKTDLRIAFSRKDSRRMIRFLMALPNGVIEYSPLYKDVPQTSLSLGILKTMADGMCVHSMVRSSINSQKMMMLDRIQSICDAFKAKVETKGTYPAWELIEKSAFRDLAADVYQKVTGTKPTVVVIHGGLECGLLAAKVPGLDCISLGPDMEEVHTPAERLNIPSSKRTYDYIKALLEVCADA